MTSQKSSGIPELPDFAENVWISENCPACFEKRITEREKLTCGHYICLQCIYRLEQFACPCCRAPLGGDFLSPQIGLAFQEKSHLETFFSDPIHVGIKLLTYLRLGGISFTEQFFQVFKSKANIVETRLFYEFLRHVQPRQFPIQSIPVQLRTDLVTQHLSSSERKFFFETCRGSNTSTQVMYHFFGELHKICEDEKLRKKIKKIMDTYKTAI